MKKKLLILFTTLVCCFSLMACESGTTTMDQGKDTNGRAGEPNPIENSASENMEKNTKNMMDNAEKKTKDVIDKTKDAADNLTGKNGK